MSEEKEMLLKKVEEHAAIAVKKELEDFKKSLPAYATPEDIENKFTELSNTVKELGVNELKESLSLIEKAAKDQGVALQKLLETGNNDDVKTMNDIIKSTILQNKDQIASFKESSKKDIGFKTTIKAATNVVRSDISGDTQAMRVSGIGILQRRSPFIRQLFNSAGISPNNHGVIRYVDQQSRTEGSKAVAEAAAYGQSDINWIERSINIEKYGHYIKVSKEMMDDVDFVSSQINTELITGLNLKVDADLLSGNGTSPILKGLAQSATAFAAGSYANTVQDAQLYDLIAVIVSQIMTGTSYIPDTVLLNQLDATVKMKLKKDGENNYIMPPFSIMTNQGEMLIDGLRLVVNSGVAANTMYIGDFTKGTVYNSQNLDIEMGYENDDFTKGLVTVRADERLALLIREVDNGAFRKVTDINSALTAIEEVVA